MASTLVRIHGLQPEDIQVRPAAHPEDHIVVHLGDIVAVQGAPGQMKYLFQVIEERIGYQLAQKPPRIGDREPF